MQLFRDYRQRFLQIAFSKTLKRSREATGQNGRKLRAENALSSLSCKMYRARDVLDGRERRAGKGVVRASIARSSGNVWLEGPMRLSKVKLGSKRWGERGHGKILSS